jgi:hypothetical protein
MNDCASDAVVQQKHRLLTRESIASAEQGVLRAWDTLLTLHIIGIYMRKQECADLRYVDCALNDSFDAPYGIVPPVLVGAT